MPSPNPHVGVPKPSTSECALIWKYGVSQDEVTLARVGLPLIKGGAVGTEGITGEQLQALMKGPPAGPWPQLMPMLPQEVRSSAPSRSSPRHLDLGWPQPIKHLHLHNWPRPLAQAGGHALREHKEEPP